TPHNTIELHDAHPIFTTRRCLETDEARVQRVERNGKKELRRLADKISIYGRSVHKRYPTGDVVVSERDLAEQLRKHTDIVATARSVEHTSELQSPDSV